MVDGGGASGKNSDMINKWLAVVAGALEKGDGRWLMHRRPFEKHHGGLWEFPGGKVEPAEIPVFSLVRELREELGIDVRAVDCMPVTFAEDVKANSNPAIVILLYKIRIWRGEPKALEGGEVDWFTPQEVAALDKPPLDMELASRLFGRT